MSVKEREGSETADRVWLTLKRNFRVAEYESLGIELGVASSAEPGETARDAVRRVFGDLRVEFGEVLEVMRAQEQV